MAEIELPYLRSTTTLAEAVQILQKTGLGGLVIERADGPALVTRAELGRALDSAGEDAPVGDVPPTPLARQVKLPRNPDEILYSTISRRGFEAALAGEGPRYSVVNVSGDTASVRTESEPLLALLKSGTPV